MTNRMRTALRLLAVVAATAACRPEASPNPGFDFSAMTPFWAIQATLAADREPSEAEWAALLDTPGYRALTASEFSPEFFRSNFALAYMPSKAGEREAALSGPNGRYLRHYIDVAQHREQLTQQVEWLRSSPEERR